MKWNEHQRRKEIVEFNARECAETIVEEGFSILEYGKSEREISMVKSIQMVYPISKLEKAFTCIISLPCRRKK